MKVLGIDASTSATGLVVLEDGKLVHHEAILFKGCNTFWEKCDRIYDALIELDKHHTIERFYIEEPMKRFAEGFSSAETLSILQRFNGIVCYLVRERFGVDPTYVNVSSARKAAGIKVTTKAKAGGRNAKQQTFDHVMANELSYIEWPKKQRSDNIVDWAKDVVDAWVVARGGHALSQTGS